MMKRMQKGTTLLEMLVGVAVFSIMMIGVYYFFDSGRWMYLKSESRANLQENGRLSMEAMEREIRLISFGVPSGTEIGTQSTWVPAIFLADRSQIGFRGDVDNINSLVTQDITTGDTVINVEWPSLVCPSNGTPVVLVQRERNWLSYTCSNPNDGAGTMSINAGAGADFLAAETEIYSPTHVFYRLTPDIDGDGICDDSTATKPDYSQCIIERAVRSSTTPQTTVASVSDWQTFATNIEQFQLEYFRKQGTVTELTALPLNGTDRALVDVIRITIRATGRSDQVQDYVSNDFISDILIRKRKF
jgi:prepilin-type N-terminal cleavage/methylation domain-containing protein